MSTILEFYKLPFRQFHENSQYQKNPKISTLCLDETFSLKPHMIGINCSLNGFFKKDRSPHLTSLFFFSVPCFKRQPDVWDYVVLIVEPELPHFGDVITKENLFVMLVAFITNFTGLIDLWLCEKMVFRPENASPKMLP